MFGLFKSQSAQLDLTPRSCLVVSLIYGMGADGEIEPEELGHLSAVLGRNARLPAVGRLITREPLRGSALLHHALGHNPAPPPSALPHAPSGSRESDPR